MNSSLRCTAVFALAAAAFLFPPSHAVRAAGVPDLLTIRVVSAPNDDATALLYAQRTGMFGRAGLDVQLAVGRSGSAIMAAVLGGTFDIGKTSIPTIFAAHEKGIPLTIVAPAAVYDSRSPLGGMIVAKGGPIREGKDLVGKVASVAGFADIGQIAIDSWVKQAGGDPKSVKYIELPMTAVAAAIAQDRVSGGEIVNPPLANALATDDVQLIPVFNAVAQQFLLSAWIAESGWASAHRDAVKRFARVLAQAAAYANNHHDDTVEMVAAFTSTPIDTVKRMPRVFNGVTLNAALVQPVIDASASAGVLEHRFAAKDILDPDVLVK